jgi:predicted O-methyltransferase YrrM
LPTLQGLENPIQVVFLDGHHDGEATIQYFNEILPYIAESCVFILDDIRWSEDMYWAWKKLCYHPRVRNNFDLFQWGILMVGR